MKSYREQKNFSDGYNIKNRVSYAKQVDKAMTIVYTDDMINKTKVSCLVCGKSWEVETWITKRKKFTSLCESCSKKRLGYEVGIKGESRRAEKSARWTGGRYQNAYGYIIYTLRPEEDYFQPMAKNNKLMEHRFIMAKHLSRCLFP